MKIVGLLVVFIGTVGLTLFGRSVMAADVKYAVKELRFDDSPDQGAVFERDPNCRNSFICAAMRLSQNDRISGVIVAKDGKDHLFIYEDGNVKDINTLAGLSGDQANIGSDGTVVGIVGDAHLMLYQSGKMQEITTPEVPVDSIGELTASGQFLLNSGGEGYLCNVKSPKERIKVPLGTLTDSGIIVGVGMNDKSGCRLPSRTGRRIGLPRSRRQPANNNWIFMRRMPRDNSSRC